MTAAGTGTATILYTDLVGSTEMRTRLGDAAAEQVRRRHDELLGTVIGRYGGTVVKGLGDGILATFGASADAVGAAHDIQREIDRTNRQVAEDRRLRVRIGLSAGDVSWDDGDCHGTPVITAARLCDACDGGQILCDDLVRGLARGHTELQFRLVGELELKGLSDRVAAYEVPWAPAPAERAPLPGALRPQPTELPFAGRDTARLRLAEAWKRAQVDGSAVVLVAGEPGIGKTRLAAESARQAHADGALVLLGRCDEHIAAPHAPWIEAMRTLVAHAGDDALADHVARSGGELARLVPELARHVPGMPPPTPSDPDTERLLLFDAVVDALASAATFAPVFLLVDDAHWADGGSVQLLRHVVNHLDPDAHVLLVITYRDTDVDRRHALAGALADLNRAAGAERIVLRGLDESEMRALLEAAGGHPLQPEGVEFAHRLAEETDGNPLFVRQLLRHLIENGTLVQRDGIWVGTVSSGEAGIPEGVRDLIGQRLSRLSDATNDLLRTAAVVGREFEVDLVATVAKVDDDAAVDGFDEAVAAQLVEEVADHPGRLTFAHALVRQTLLEELSTNKRVRLHRQIAELLDARPNTPIDVLAHHYCEAAVAGVASRAIECACAAAEAAGARFAWDDAIRLYERALEAVDALEEDDPALRSHVLAQTAVAENGAGNAERAHERALAAADLARAAGDPARLAEAGIAYQGQLGMWAAPADPVAAALIREGLDRLPPDRLDVRARAQAALAHGVVLAPGTTALTEADAAVRAAREAGDDRALRHALTVRAWAVRGVLPAAERARVAQDAIDACRAAGDRYLELASHYHLGNARLAQGDLSGAADEFVTTSEYRGALEGWAIADYQASLAVAQGRLAEAKALSDEAHGLGASLGDTIDGVHALQHGLIARVSGDLDSAWAWHERSICTAVGSAMPTGALCALVAGDHDAARAHLEAWAEQVPPRLSALMRYSSAPLAARLAFELDDLTGLDWLPDYLETFVGELLATDVTIVHAADVVRGLVAALQGRLDHAVELVEAGHALHARLGLSQLEVESAIELATVLLRRDQDGDSARARAVLDPAVELGEELGMAPAVAQARRLLG